MRAVIDTNVLVSAVLGGDLANAPECRSRLMHDPHVVFNFMPKEILPSSHECDCGLQSHFFENTSREAKAKSHRKKIYLGDSEPDEHIIVFYKGEMVDIICPNRPLRSAETSKV